MFDSKATWEGALGQLPATVHRLVPDLVPQSFLFLEGDLGAGKTSLAKFLIADFGVLENVASPTFSLMNVYTLPKPKQGIARILHLDLYRVRNGKELCLLGLEREFQHDTLCVIEWASLIEETDWSYFFDLTGCAKPLQKLKLEIEIQSSASRSYTLSSLL
jgi:tRNA threonylcarbamoyladenosine biosynthesis protein TsaE